MISRYAVVRQNTIVYEFLRMVIAELSTVTSSVMSSWRKQRSISSLKIHLQSVDQEPGNPTFVCNGDPLHSIQASISACKW